MHLSQGGVLFLILPKRCIQNKNIEGSDQFVNLLKVFGFRLLEDPHFTPRLAFYVLSRDDGLYECSIRKLKSNSLGSQDSNDPLHVSLSHVMKLVVKDSKDKATKEFFRKEDMITDEFCLRFPSYW